MQILKEDVRHCLLEKAAAEFYEHGFNGASVRKIAKAAGMTIGNFYHYFRNKEDLFNTITDPVYASFQHFLQHLVEVRLPGMHKRVFRERLVCYILEYEMTFTRELVLLLECSAGTKYESAKEDYLGYLTNRAKSLYEPEGYDDRFCRLIAVGFLHSFVGILKAGGGDEEIAGMIADLIVFYTDSR